MRRLLLLRHAKSSWAEPGASDHERPLNRRGQEAAPRIGAYLGRHKLIPDIVLCSSAQRTRETWALVAGEFKAAPSVAYVDRLYDATWRAVLDVVRRKLGPRYDTARADGPHLWTTGTLAVRMFERHATRGNAYGPAPPGRSGPVGRAAVTGTRC